MLTILTFHKEKVDFINVGLNLTQIWLVSIVHYRSMFCITSHVCLEVKMSRPFSLQGFTWVDAIHFYKEISSECTLESMGWLWQGHLEKQD